MNRSSFPSFVVLFLVVGASVWFGFQVSTEPAAGHAQSRQTLQTENARPQYMTELRGLLQSDGLRINENSMLPDRAERSTTVLVKFSSDGLDRFLSQIPDAYRVTLVTSKRGTGPVSLQRGFELSPGLILAVAVNKQKQVLWWDLQPDPRIIRAETADDAGSLSGNTLFKSEAEMLVSLPADTEITDLRFYHPAWDGVNSYSLEPIGVSSLSEKK